MGWTGSPEERKLYAIRKRRQRAYEERAERRNSPSEAPREPVAGFSVHPHNHPCGTYPGEIEEVSPERAQCKVCGRTWTLGSRGWVPSPLTKRKPPLLSEGSLEAGVDKRRDAAA